MELEGFGQNGEIEPDGARLEQSELQRLIQITTTARANMS